MLVVKNLLANEEDARDAGSIPGSWRSPGEGNGNPLQCSCLENPMDSRAWWATVRGVWESDTTELACVHVHTHTHTTHTHMVFPVVMYRGETIKKAECQRIDVFKLWCWRRLSRVPWTARRSHQSILKDINPEYSLEGLRRKLQHSCHLMWRTGKPGVPQSVGSQAVRHDLVIEQLGP